MKKRILIVEDEMLVAFDMQDILEANGFAVAGIAADVDGAKEYDSPELDLALVDLNLRDGLTGPSIGARLRDEGVPVLFVTANPAQLGDGLAGTIGVLTKPADEASLLKAVQFIFDRQASLTPDVPAGLRLFG